MALQALIAHKVPIQTIVLRAVTIHNYQDHPRGHYLLSVVEEVVVHLVAHHLTEALERTLPQSDGSTVSIPSATSLVGGVITSYNQSGSGVAGVTGQNCGTDNCNQAGGNGGASYNGAVSGGTGRFGSAGDAGSQGSGGGGGGAQPQTAGGAGGTGEIVYRFLRVT